jgi:hypothetical protein
VVVTLRYVDLQARCRQDPACLNGGQALALIDSLGGLARWWLRDVVRQRAEAEVPGAYPPACWQFRLPTQPGSCWIIYAQEQDDTFPLLRPAFLLPLRWVAGQPHSRQLPVDLRCLAARAAETLEQKGWGLQLSSQDGIDQLDLSQVDFPPDSGWAAVAAGLLLAVEGGRPSPDVWATGQWHDQGGIVEVGKPEAKLALALELGVREFFVPERQVAELESKLHGRSCLIRPLGFGRHAPRSALADYLLHLDHPPDRLADLSIRSDYFLRQPNDRKPGSYYWNNLLPDIIESLSRQRTALPGCSPSHLVTIVSQSVEVSVMSARATGVRQCLLLFTGDFAKQKDTLAAQLQGVGIQTRTAEIIDDEQLAETIRIPVREFAAAIAPHQLVFDLVPGTKLMTLELEKLARTVYPGSWLLYVRHQTTSQHRQKPGTERLRLWTSSGLA